MENENNNHYKPSPQQSCNNHNNQNNQNTFKFTASNCILVTQIIHIQIANTVTESLIFGCRGVVQLGGLVQGSPSSVHLRLRLLSLFYLLKVPKYLK